MAEIVIVRFALSPRFDSACLAPAYSEVYFCGITDSPNPYFFIKGHICVKTPSSYSKNPLSVISKTSGLDRNLSSSQPPPIANAGSNQTVTAGLIVTLNGSKSKSPNGIILAYSWMQVPTGSSTSLGGVNTPVWQFVAPKVTSNTLIRFQLNVTDNVGQSGTAFVNILDKPFTKFATLL